MSSGVQLEKATLCGAGTSTSTSISTSTSTCTSTSDAKSGKLLLPMDLLDEYWFFNNTLNSKKISLKPPKTPQSGKKDDSVVAHHAPPASPLVSSPRAQPSDTSNTDDEIGDDDVLPVPVPLMRAPSMPSPYTDGFDDAYSKITELNGSTKLPKGSKLRHSSSTLGCHHSWHSALEKAAPPRPSLTRQHSSMSSRKYCLQHNYRLINDPNYRIFQDKKWRSSSDLESIEVQGFKDLGFVFDKKELKESLSNVIPGLREKKQTEDQKVARPYLSEAWCPPPAPSFDWKEKKSTAEMKDQLRFWARAVACNAKQEC